MAINVVVSGGGTIVADVNGSDSGSVSISGDQQPVEVSVTGGIGPAAFISGTAVTAVGVNPIAAGDYITISTTGGSVEISANPPVLSVNGRTGVVSLIRSDFTAAAEIHTHSVSQVSDFTTKANVVSVNGRTGVVSIVGGSNVTVSTTTSSIVVSSADGIPSQSGQSGKVLSTNGTNSLWVSRFSVVDDTLAAGSHIYFTRNTTAGTITISGDVAAGVPWSGVPTAYNTPADAGEIAYNSEYLFVAVAENTWKRIPLETWLLDPSLFSITTQPADQSVTLAASGSITLQNYAGDNEVYQSLGIVQRNGVYRGIGTNSRWYTPVFPNSVGETSLQGYAIHDLWLFGTSLPDGYIPFTLGDSTNQKTIMAGIQWYGSFNPFNARDVVVLSPTSQFDGTPETVNVTETWIDLTSTGKGDLPNGSYVLGPMGLGGAVAAATNADGTHAIIACRARTPFQDYGGDDHTFFSGLYNSGAGRVGLRNPFARAVNSENGVTFSVPTVQEEAFNFKPLLPYDVIWANGEWLAIADSVDDATSWCLRSVTGLSWSLHAMPFGLHPISVAYGNGAYVAVGTVNPWAGINANNGENYYTQQTNDLLYSQDGQSWQILQNVLPATTIWTQVAYLGGAFIAFSAMGAAVSSDGQTWSLIESAPQPATPPFLEDTYNAVYGTPYKLHWQRKFNTLINGDTRSVFFSLSSGNGNAWEIAYSGTGAGTATLSFAYTDGSNATIAIQWQTRASSAGTFADVAGATSTTLSLSGLTSADNGRQYLARIQRSGGSDQPVGVTETYYTSTATLSVA